MDLTRATQPASTGLGSVAPGMGAEQAPAPLNDAASVTAAPTVAAARATRTARRPADQRSERPADIPSSPLASALERVRGRERLDRHRVRLLGEPFGVPGTAHDEPVVHRH